MDQENNPIEKSAEVKTRGRPSVPELVLREKIYQATKILLLNESYPLMTMDLIAKTAGVSKKTVYRFAKNRSELIEQIVKSWTDSFIPLFEQKAQSYSEFFALLETNLIAISEKVLSTEAVGLYRLLLSDLPERELLLAKYQHNGIERGRLILKQWLDKHPQFIGDKETSILSDLILAMTIAEPLRQMALKLVKPMPEYNINPRVKSVIDLLKTNFIHNITI